MPTYIIKNPCPNTVATLAEFGSDPGAPWELHGDASSAWLKRAQDALAVAEQTAELGLGVTPDPVAPVEPVQTADVAQVTEAVATANAGGGLIGWVKGLFS